MNYNSRIKAIHEINQNDYHENRTLHALNISQNVTFCELLAMSQNFRIEVKFNLTNTYLSLYIAVEQYMMSFLFHHVGTHSLMCIYIYSFKYNCISVSPTTLSLKRKREPNKSEIHLFLFGYPFNLGNKFY